MRDWAGLERKESLPVRMKFADPEDRDLIGRRRPVKADHKHLIPYPQPLTRIRNFDGHNLLPNTAGVCSESDKVSIRLGSAVDRSVKEYDVASSTVQEEPLFAAPDEYISRVNTDKSSRFRSTVERGVNDERESVSLRNPLRESPRFEETLDPGHVVIPEGYNCVVPTVNSGNSQSRALSKDSRRNVFSSSSFMDDLSSLLRSPTHSPSDMDEPRPLRFSRSPKDYTALSGADGSDWILPDPDEQTLVEPGLRLVVQDTPYSYGNISQDRPLPRDSALVGAQAPLTQQRPPLRLQDQHACLTGGREVESDPAIASFASTTPDWALATSQVETDHHHHHVRGAERHPKPRDGITNSFCPRLRKSIESPLPDANVGFHEADKALLALPESKVPQQEPCRPRGEEMTWKPCIAPRTTEDARFSEGKQMESEIIANTLTQDPSNIAASVPSLTEKEPPKAAEEEEKIWQNFIFSGDDLNENNEWTLEESPSQPNSPYNPARTQPSMIAEVDTSPLKQNPHLIESTSTNSTDSLDVSSNQNRPSNSSYDPQFETTSSDILDQATFEPDLPQNFPSISGQASESPTTFDNPANIPPPSLDSLVRTASNIPPSSLLAQASSTSAPTVSLPQQLSSDELAPGWSPARPDLKSAKLKEPKVVFTPPKRYVGENANEPSKPLYIGGRVLRNGEKTEASELKQAVKGNGGGKRGRPRKRILQEIEGDEILDD
ncbi:hypothetical protein P7C71_g5035, partial [Lecanoromycetidae sp. Uapishka_2]